MIRYTFIHKNDPKKIPARDHWGKPIICNTRQEAENEINLPNVIGFHSTKEERKEFLIIEIKSKVKNVGVLKDLNWDYWPHL